MGKLRIHSIDAGFWALAESAVTSYLLEGEKSALLIDSGWNTPQIRMHPGDYSFYHDRNKGTGDLLPLWEGQVLAHKHSLQRLMTEFGGRIRELYPAHGSFPLGPDILPELIRGIGEVLADRIPGSQVWEDDAVVHLYDIGVAGILYEAKEHRKYL